MKQDIDMNGSGNKKPSWSSPKFEMVMCMAPKGNNDIGNSLENILPKYLPLGNNIFHKSSCSPEAMPYQSNLLGNC